MLTALFTTSWPPLSQEVYLIEYWYNGILSNVTGMNSIPQCNDSTGILPNTNVRMYINMLHYIVLLYLYNTGSD